MLYVNPVANLKAGTQPNDPARRQAALQELDHMFIFQLLQEMRKTVPKDSLLGGKGMEQDTYNEMLDDAMAGNMAKSGQFGVAAQVEAQLKAAEAQQTQPVSKNGFLPLHPEAKPIALNPRNLTAAAAVERPFLSLRQERSAAKAFSLIKAPLRLADN